MINVLFLCTGNSARSILAESLLNEMGRGRFTGFSAGIQPKGEPHAHALRLLERLGHPVTGLHSKSWESFARPEAPALDIVITVCDNAAGEACPVWPGHPASGHWGIADPAAVRGSDQDMRLAFLEAYAQLADRIGSFVAAPIETMSADDVKRKLAEIGDRCRIPGAA